MNDRNLKLLPRKSIFNNANNVNDVANPLLNRGNIRGSIDFGMPSQVNDEDRDKIYLKIVELLIAAGYFRARLQNLEPFDKV